MKIVLYRLRHWLMNHEYVDYSVNLTICYYCESCGLQKTKLGYRLWWYRIAPWIKGELKRNKKFKESINIKLHERRKTN